MAGSAHTVVWHGRNAWYMPMQCLGRQISEAICLACKFVTLAHCYSWGCVPCAEYLPAHVPNANMCVYCQHVCVLYVFCVIRKQRLSRW